jgi:hypothetical protein
MGGQRNRMITTGQSFAEMVGIDLKKKIDLDKNQVKTRSIREFINPDVILKAPEILMSNDPNIPDADLSQAIYAAINDTINKIGPDFLNRRVISMLYDMVTSNKVNLTEESKIKLFKFLINEPNRSEIFAIGCQFISFYHYNEYTSLCNRLDKVSQRDIYKILASKHSSFDEYEQVSMVNKAILEAENVISAQEVIWIYEVLYDRLPALIIDTLCDASIVKPNTDIGRITNMLIGLFTILENVPRASILNILSQYSIIANKDKFIREGTKPVLYDVQGMSSNRFPRTYQCIQDQINTGLRFPVLSLYK